MSLLSTNNRVFGNTGEAFGKQQKLEALTKTNQNMSREEVLVAQKADSECTRFFRAQAGEVVPLAVRNDADHCIDIDGTLYRKDSQRKCYLDNFSW